MNLCPACGIAASHNRQGGPCLACYRTGSARTVDVEPHRHRVAALTGDGWTLTDIAGLAGCSRQAIANIHAGRTTRIRAGLADALDQIVTGTDESCRVCQDTATVAMSTSDPASIAARVGKTVQVLQRHLYFDFFSLLGQQGKAIGTVEDAGGVLGPFHIARHPEQMVSSAAQHVRPPKPRCPWCPRLGRSSP